MKNLKLFIVALFMLGTTNSFSQLQTVSSEEYGRIFDLVYDQTVSNRIYAASMNNHILVSNDNGVSWEIFYSFTYGYVKELRMLNDTHLSFFLTNTADATETTIHLLELSTMTDVVINRPINADTQDRTIEDYSIYEANTDIMLYKELYTIGLDNRNRVHYTVDGGTNWTLVYDEFSNNEISVDKILIHPTDPTILFVTRGNGANGVNGGVLISTDAGTSFTEYYAGENIRAVAVDPNNTDHWMIGTDPGWGQSETIYETIDAAANWTENVIVFDTYFEKAINEIIFHPTIANKIYILETNEIAISTDGGATWTVTVYDPWTPTYYFGMSATFNPDDADEVIYTSNWYPYHSTDGGTTINRMYTPFSMATFAGVSIPEVGQDSYLYYGVQGGFVSQNLATSAETDYNIQSIDLVSGGTEPQYYVDPSIYGRLFSATGDWGGNNVNVSTDHGQTFTTFYTGFFDPVLHVVPDPTVSNEVWVALDGWAGSVTSIIDMNSVDPFSPTMTSITLPSAYRHTVTFINPTNNQEVLAGLGGEIWSSLDRGITWTNSSVGLTLNQVSGFIYEIVQSPYNLDEYLLSTVDGLWQSTDGYATWTKILNANNVRRVAYDPNRPTFLIATTYSSANSDASIYFSEDSGASWTMVPLMDLAYCSSTSMAIQYMDDASGATIYIATADLGVVTYDFMYDLTGIDAIAKDGNGINVYPNPVENVMNISLENGAIPTSIVIYTMTGEEVRHFTNQSQFDLSQLKAGVYLVKVSNENGRNSISKIVKK